jgi:hypothetical protein
MADSPLWFVRAGKDGAFVDEFRADGVVAIGWREVGPLSADVSDDEIDALFSTHYPNSEENARSVWANQVRRYLREIRIGDEIATYDPRSRQYILGRVESDVEWADRPLPRRRRVTWTQAVPRDALSEGTRNRLGSIATLFRVGPEPRVEVLQNAAPLDGSVPTPRRAPPLAKLAQLPTAGFDALRRNQRAVSWPSLPEDDRGAIRDLRGSLLALAGRLRDELGSRTALRAFASHPSPSGRNSLYYWACVHPVTAPNKSFAFQLFMIARPDTFEIGFGSGSATGEAGPDILEGLRAQFEGHRARLRALRNQPWVAHLGVQIASKGFELRSRWLQAPRDTNEFADIGAWIDHATSDSGGGAAVSKFLSAEEALAAGDTLGDRLVSELRVFVPLLDAIYGDALPDAEDDPPPPPPELTLDWLTAQTLWEPTSLEEMVDSLERTKQIILAGPPGTSKTWLAQLLARYVTRDRPGGVKVVQLHPSYSYEEFVEGLRPTVVDGTLAFEPHRGVLLRMASLMTDGDVPRILVLDEMNRANLPRVFGELLYLLEYRDTPIDLQYSAGFKMPTQLLLIGTMNTADRSIRGIDVALRRRFDVFECRPDAGVLERFYETRDNDVPDLLDGFVALNAALTIHLDRHHTIGHAFFMADPMDARRLRHVWNHKIGPLIEEYFFDQPDVAAEFTLARFWPSTSRED